MLFTLLNNFALFFLSSIVSLSCLEHCTVHDSPSWDQGRDHDKKDAPLEIICVRVKNSNRMKGVPLRQRYIALAFQARLVVQTC